MAEYVHNAIIALHNIDSALFHALQNKIRLNMSLSNSVALNFEYSIY